MQHRSSRLRHEFILGGQRSGKSRCAELRAQRWLAQPGHSAVRVPSLQVDEAPRELALAVSVQSTPARLIVINCLALWLTNLLMPLHGEPLLEATLHDECEALCAAIRQAPGPVVIASNEIVMGLSPMTLQTRHFVDELGRLHQSVAAVCERVTLMVAGIEVAVKREPA